MASPLTWVLQLHDRVSGPAKTIAHNMGEVRESMAKAKESIVAIAEGVGLERLAEKVIDLGKEFAAEVLQANKFATETKIAFDVLLGSSSKANEMFEETRKFAIQAGVPLEGVASAYKALLLGGVAEKNIHVIMNAASDLAALGPKGVSMESYAQSFADIASQGSLAGRSLAQFKGLLDFGVLSKKLGIAAHDYKGLAAALNAAPVAAGKGMKAILETLALKEGGALGTVRSKLADTFSGVTTSIKEELLGLFEFDSSDSPILKLLMAIRDGLNGPLLANIKEGFMSFMDGLGLSLRGGGVGFDSFLKSIREGTILGQGFKDTMKGVGEVLHYVAEGASLVASAIKTVGGGIGKGAAAAAQALGIGPEVTFGNIAPGANAATGLVPHFAEGGHVDGPTLALVGEGGEGESIVPDSKIGKVGGRVTVQLTQTFNIGGDSAGGGQALARHIAQIGASELEAALESLAMQMGAA